MQTSRRCRVGLQLPFHFIILIAIAMTMPAGAQDSAAVQLEEAPHKFYLGYDQGISARLQINPLWTAGLIVGTSGWGGLYFSSYDDVSNSSGTSSQTRRINDFSLYLETIRVLKKWRHFTINGFVSVGGGLDKNIATSHLDNPDDGMIDLIDLNEYEQTILNFRSRAGIMPGFTYGILSFEMRLGLEGIYSRTTSSRDSYDQRNGESMHLSLVYPSSFLAGIIVHVALF